jgi:threonine dehydratase
MQAPPSPTAETVARRLAEGAAEEARAAGADLVRRTPVLTSRSLGEAVGGRIVLKAENLQRTGSFKLRGALSRLAHLTPEERAAGVVAGSAGNHAQALAFAARARGVRCEVFMPATASVSKVAAVEAYGGTVRLGGDSVDECVGRARERAADGGAAFVHPFDDPYVIAGQATLGLELIEDVEDLAAVIVPIGGGGLASGVAAMVRAARPDARVVGVQARACAPVACALRGGDERVRPTIADGIAIKRPGGLTLPLLERWLDDVCTVEEDDVAEAIVLMLERAKLVVEGAGAVGVAALLSGAVKPAEHGATVVVLSGGNIASGLLAEVTRRHETAEGRRLLLFTRVSDRPGGLAALLNCVAEAGGNLVSVEHVREAVALHVAQTGVELTLETRSAEHGSRVVTALREAGYQVEILGHAPDPRLTYN